MAHIGAQIIGKGRTLEASAADMRLSSERNFGTDHSWSYNQFDGGTGG